MKSTNMLPLWKVGTLRNGLRDIVKTLFSGVAIHYPDIVDDVNVIKIINRLHRSDINLKTVFLKIMCKRVDILGGISDFKCEDWSKFLENENPEVQLITLDIMLKVMCLLGSDFWVI